MELLLHLLVVLRGLLLHLRVWGVGRVYVEWSDQHALAARQAATISACTGQVASYVEWIFGEEGERGETRLAASRPAYGNPTVQKRFRRVGVCTHVCVCVCVCV